MDIVDRLARARVGSTHNQYTRSQLRRDRLRTYLAAHASAEIVLVGEAAGYRGARISGVPFTSERQLTGTGPAEASATISTVPTRTPRGSASTSIRHTAPFLNWIG